MRTVKLLIDLAREKVPSDAELARKIGETPQNLAGIKAGRRPISDRAVAALCDLLQLPGEEAREWLAIAAAERAKTPAEANLIRRALFVCWALGVAALSIPTNDAQGKTVACTDRLEASSGYGQCVDGLSIVAHLLRGAARVLMAAIVPFDWFVAARHAAIVPAAANRCRFAS